MPIIKNCLTCEKEFKTVPSKIKIGHGKYCSCACQPPHPSEKKGKKLSEETKQKMSKSHIGRCKGSENHRWKGGRKYHIMGYILVLQPHHPFCNSKGYILEHRLVVEKQIGRYLSPDEIGHHLGKKDDNRPHMLMAFVNNSVHTRFHGNPNNVKPQEIIFDGRALASFS